MSILSAIKDKISKRNLILILVIFFLLIIATILFLVLNYQTAEKEVQDTFSSMDSSIEISLLHSLNFSVVEDESYVMALRSSTSGSSIYVSKTSTTNIRDAQKFVEADKTDYISKFSDISQVSDVTETTIQGLTTYNYHFYYSETRFVDVYWILKDSTFYIIDFKINTNVDDFSSQVGDILDNIKFN